MSLVHNLHWIGIPFNNLKILNVADHPIIIIPVPMNIYNNNNGGNVRVGGRANKIMQIQMKIKLMNIKIKTMNIKEDYF